MEYWGGRLGLVDVCHWGDSLLRVVTQSGFQPRFSVFLMGQVVSCASQSHYYGLNTPASRGVLCSIVKINFSSLALLVWCLITAMEHRAWSAARGKKN